MAQRTVLSIALVTLLSGPTATSVWAQAPDKQAKPVPGRAKKPARAQDTDRQVKRPDVRARPSPSARMRHDKVRERLKEARPDGSGRTIGALRGLRGPKGEMSEALERRLKQMASTRAERRSKRRAGLSKRWGEWVERREFRSVFRRHAWRMARLRRIVEIATEKENTALAKRAQKLIKKEEQRHAKQLQKLKRRAATTASSARPGPSAMPATSED